MQVRMFSFFGSEGQTWKVKIPVCLECERAADKPEWKYDS